MVLFECSSASNRSEWAGRQNARRRVRFDKIFASFSSLPAAGGDWKRKSQSGLRTEKFEHNWIIFFLPTRI
jgi:hypothetical protein